MTERKIILLAIACEMRQLSEDLYNAVNNNDDTATNTALHDIRKCSLYLQLTNSNLITPDMKSKYLK
jgi:hypothetical protein